jgi:hypothetical protein
MATTGMHRHGYRSPGSRERNPDVCEVVGELQDYDRSMLIGWISRRYQASWFVTIMESWNRNYADPMVVCRYIEDLVGETIHRIARLVENDRVVHDMIRALEPHFEREIHHFIERVERESTYLRDGPGRRVNPEMYYTGTGFAPAEDPKAKKKARDLLLKNLDPEQTAAFKKERKFSVVGKDKKVYTITDARSFNVVGPDGVKYCGQLVNTPIEDQMLAQKLLLEHDPDKFFKNANTSGGMTATEVTARHAFGEAMLREIRSGHSMLRGFIGP